MVLSSIRRKNGIHGVAARSFLNYSRKTGAGINSHPNSYSLTNDKNDTFFTLDAMTNEGVRADYLYFLKDALAEIGIDLNVSILTWPEFVMQLIAYRDFDICYVGLTGDGADPDMTGFYNENGSLNLFGYDTSMDYNETLGTGLNEWYIDQGNQIMPPGSEERVQHYWEWEQYLMDEILQLVPTHTPLLYEAAWKELTGYNYTEGLLQSWGKMSWEGTHEGQTGTNEVVIADDAWSDLNPLFQDDSPSSFISSATMDPLLWVDADGPFWPHLAKEIEQINDTYIRIHTREGIKWQPDLEGNFTDEYFNAEDVYFTLYVWGGISCDCQTLCWIEDMVLVDEHTLDIFIDGDRSTPEKESYAPYLAELATKILPEHYLNQTQHANGVTPDINHPSWKKFATHCFGTGLFQITTFQKGEETELTVYDDCWRLNETITNDSALDWNKRFGNFTGGLDTLRVRIISNRTKELAEFDTGKLDKISLSDNGTLINYYQNNSSFQTQSTINYYLPFFGFNMREERGTPMQSREPCPGNSSLTRGLAIRKAIAYALDREDFINTLLDGRAEINHWPIYQKQRIWCNPNIIRYDHDLALAEYYLELAGFPETTTSPSNTTAKDSIAIGQSLLLAVIPIIAAVPTIIIIVRRRKQQ